ncbi:MAG: glycosyltransferase family 4 protein [Flavobacteriales bacterium]
MSSKSRLHVVSFAVPFPPDYGGVIDVFYKIKQLNAAGVSIVLHVFQYDGRQSAELEKYCEKIYYYPRHRSFFDQLSSLPFIVKSRTDEKLLLNLQKDEAPILFEGLHTTCYINHPSLLKRKRYIRMHNIESDYYYHLYKAERSWTKKLFFYLESLKLARYEKNILGSASGIFTVSEKDKQQLQSYGNVHFVGAFHSFDEVSVQKGKSNYALYHGKLDVAENNEAALFLVNEVFSKSDYPLVIAGSNPSRDLLASVAKRKNIEVRTGLPTKEIHRLLAEAHINALPTFQATGVKLKLLSALYSGRFCLVNDAMVQGTGLADYCVIAEKAEQWLEEINRLKNLEFDDAQIARRQSLLSGSYSNSINAAKLYALIFPSS